MPNGIADVFGRLEFIWRENRFFETLLQGLGVVRPKE